MRKQVETPDQIVARIPPDGREGHWLAAARTCGDGAVLSRQSAAQAEAMALAGPLSMLDP
jgi:hypothetical protein